MTIPTGNHAIDSFAVTAGLVEGPDAAATRLEVSLAVDALGLRRGGRVLDLPCGNGRHAVALADLGFEVTAVDVDEASLAAARARGPRSDISFHHADVLAFSGEPDGYDAVLSFFSCLGYFESEAWDRAMLARFAAWIRPAGGLLLSTANRTAIACRPHAPQWFRAGGQEVLRKDHYCAATGYLTRSYEITSGPEAAPRHVTHRRRLYAPEELGAMLEGAGLTLTAIYGDFAGTPFDRENALHAVYLCRRPG